MDLQDYRHGVCMVLTRSLDNRILVCHRTDSADEKTGWQLPQGGIESAGDLIAEAKRELREEIGTDAIVVKKITDHWYHYDYPGGPHDKHGKVYRGQCHRYVLAELIANDADIRFDTHHHAEFNGFKWTNPAAVVKQIVNFKSKAYQAAFEELGLL